MNAKVLQVALLTWGASISLLDKKLQKLSEDVTFVNELALSSVQY